MVGLGKILWIILDCHRSYNIANPLRMLVIPRLMIPTTEIKLDNIRLILLPCISFIPYDGTAWRYVVRGGRMKRQTRVSWGWMTKIYGTNCATATLPSRTENQSIVMILDHYSLTLF